MSLRRRSRRAKLLSNCTSVCFRVAPGIGHQCNASADGAELPYSRRTTNPYQSQIKAGRKASRKSQMIDELH